MKLEAIQSQEEETPQPVNKINMYQTTNVFVFVSIKGLRTVKTWHRSNNVINASATATFFPLSRRRAKRRDRHKPQSNPL